MARSEIQQLVAVLHDAQQAMTDRVAAVSPDLLSSARQQGGFTLEDILHMWVWHFWAHHRDLLHTRGYAGDMTRCHLPNFIRQANEEFGKFIGELSCLDDAQLNAPIDESGRTVREMVQHLTESLLDYFPVQVANAHQAPAAQPCTHLTADAHG